MMQFRIEPYRWMRIDRENQHELREHKARVNRWFSFHIVDLMDQSNSKKLTHAEIIMLKTKI